MQQSLSRASGDQGVAGRVECCRKGIAHDLKDEAIVRLNRLVQDFVVPREQSWHRIGILLCQFGAAFDIGEKKSNCTCGDCYSASRMSNLL